MKFLQCFIILLVMSASHMLFAQSYYDTDYMHISMDDYSAIRAVAESVRAVKSASRGNMSAAKKHISEAKKEVNNVIKYAKSPQATIANEVCGAAQVIVESFRPRLPR